MSQEIDDKHYAYGKALYEAGKFEEAANAFRVLCGKREDPKFVEALAICLESMGCFQDAYTAWMRVAQMKPNHPRAHFQAAGCALTIGKPQDAKQHLVNASRLATDDLLQSKIRLLAERNFI
jgi:Flp pilus assembly protein TadD